MEPKYEEYTLGELYDVCQNIDRERHPERFNKICELIALKAALEKNEQINIIKENKKIGDTKILTRIFWAVLSLFFFIFSYSRYIKGVLMSRDMKREILSVNDNPVIFHLVIMVFVATGVFLLYIAIFCGPKSKKT